VFLFAESHGYTTAGRQIHTGSARAGLAEAFERRRVSLAAPDGSPDPADGSLTASLTGNPLGKCGS
jgi:hypothetical protein